MASTCSTSLVPIPNASAPNAPCVAVCESPHTIVIPGWVTPSSGPITCTIPWWSEPSEYSGIPNSSQLRSSVSTCTRESSSRIRAATGVPSVGHVVVGRRERAVGAADLAAGEPEPVERLRARDLVDEVQVDVDEPARRDLVGVPDLVEQGLWHRSAPPQSGADDREQHGLLGSWVLEVVRQVGVERDAVALEQARGAAPSQ